MTDFDDVVKRARPGSAFSNASEFSYWEPHWCGRCLRDAPFRNMGKGSGCPILAAAVLAEVIPAEWMEQPFEQWPHDAYHCIEFRPPGRGGGEPRPKPEPPRMDGLFPRPQRAVRMPVLPKPAEVTT